MILVLIWDNLFCKDTLFHIQSLANILQRYSDGYQLDGALNGWIQTLLNKVYSHGLLKNWVKEFRLHMYIIRFEIKNKSEIEKLKSRDRRIFEKSRFVITNWVFYHRMMKEEKSRSFGILCEIPKPKLFKIHGNKVWNQPIKRIIRNFRKRIWKPA